MTSRCVKLPFASVSRKVFLENPRFAAAVGSFSAIGAAAPYSLLGLKVYFFYICVSDGWARARREKQQYAQKFKGPGGGGNKVMCPLVVVPCLFPDSALCPVLNVYINPDTIRSEDR